ncbi:HAMP domain-containing sensor histidine kinase [Clostridium sp.]|uniref:sensor histidine kinase n=1 Tax=Clostridium sp. TaxID=1506 RepID=UPI0026091757|nr:HAMP domain-containing sensor histidine kinase [Clostridium sp.]
MFLNIQKLSISKKIAFIYSAILFSILIIFFFSLFLGIKFASKKEIEGNLRSNAADIIEYAKNKITIDQSTFTDLKLDNSIAYSIFDENKKLLYTSNSSMPQFDVSIQDMVLKYKDPKNEAEISYLTLKDNSINRTYYIQVSKNTDYYERYNRLFERSFLFVSILGIIICIASGRYISKSMLKPIRNISSTAKEITSKSLDRRIPVDGPDDELKELSSIFNLMVERLQSDFEKQIRFTSDVSHELRTPLAVILGHINMLKRWGKDDPEVLSNALETLQSETENMGKLIDDLLYLSMSDNNSIAQRKETFSLSILLQEVTDEALLVHADYSILCMCDKDYNITADHNAIKQVLRNLINNSIKYSNPPGNITIVVDRKKEGTSITVSDQGIGIPSEHLPHIFDRFYRVDESRNRSTGGTGLGLSIAKNIIQSHNGTITAYSKPGKGTKFEIYLPQ